MLNAWWLDHGEGEDEDEREQAMRFAWDASVKRGLELRGCCEGRDA